MANFRELLKATKAQIREVNPAEAEQLVAGGAVLVDVREPDEYEQGAVPGSIHIPRGHLESQIENRVPEHDRSIRTGSNTAAERAVPPNEGNVLLLPRKGEEGSPAAGVRCRLVKGFDCGPAR